ncbi:MAG TPA: hypothetical protein VE404_02475 [Verrucomicrobiae bacterium]|nr:hypothetical protein [Verrucomicrobiae bacterium]
MRNAKSMIALAGAVALALTLTPMFADGGAAHQTHQTPPVKMGTSGGSANDIGRLYCCGGTLGSLVMRDGVLSILSNNHILARSGSAVAGEHSIQPGLIDNNCSSTGTNWVGTFQSNYVPLGSANVDTAISAANGTAAVDTSGAIIDVGVPCASTQALAIGAAVTKSGRTTGQTFGNVQALNVNVSIQYQKGCVQGKKFTISYTNQVSITPGTFSGGGDSGSLILSNNTTNHHPVALLYAGSSSVTIGNPIQDVVNAYQAGGHTFSFVGNGACGTANAPVGGVEAALLNGPSENDIDFARTIKERHEPDLFARPGIIGAGIGADDTDPTQAVIVLYVDNSGGARAHGLPTELDGVKVKVIETDPFVAR